MSKEHRTYARWSKHIYAFPREFSLPELNTAPNPEGKTAVWRIPQALGEGAWREYLNTEK